MLQRNCKSSFISFLAPNIIICRFNEPYHFPTKGDDFRLSTRKLLLTADDSGIVPFDAQRFFNFLL